MKDNRGLSLVEIIIVVALMSILVGASVIGISMVSGKPVDKCASSLKMALTNNRLTAVGKKTSSLVIKMETDGSVWVVENLDGNTSKTKMCDKGVNVRIHYTSGSDFLMTPGDETDEISFNRSTGEFIFTTGKEIEYIEITKNHSSRVRKLVFYSLTGKVALE